MSLDDNKAREFVRAMAAYASEKDACHAAENNGMTIPAPSPLPWSIRPCPKHIGKAGKICECIRDASGKEVTDQQIMERINALHDDKVALAEALGAAERALDEAERHIEALEEQLPSPPTRNGDAVYTLIDKARQALSLARRTP